MPKRRNAGLGMARVTTLAHDIAMAHAPHAVGAVGHCSCSPIQPISFLAALFTVDFRSPDLAVLAAMTDALQAGARAIAHELGLDIQFEQAGAFDPVTFDESCVARIRVAADWLAIAIWIWFGAGHDAF